MDINRAFESENGFLVEDGPYYTGGTTSPFGLDLPIETYYLEETDKGLFVWNKFGTGVNDWTPGENRMQSYVFENAIKVPLGIFLKLYKPCFEETIDIEGRLEIE